MELPTQSSLDGLRPRDVRRAQDSLDERLALVATCRELGAPIEPATLGRFTVARSLGRGGQGCVYEGFDATLQRRVALKIPRFGHGTAHDDLTFEARALARVRHPNLVTVYSLEHCDGRPVVVMELVEGTPLSTWITATSPSLSRVLDVIASIGDGLAELHRCGLTHRDVKPANVLIEASGAPRLVDLGLAAISGSTAGAGGTPTYAAPEQRQQGTADPATDQYGLAATLLAAIGGERARPETWAVPRAVKNALLRALAERPADRHADVAAFVRALGASRRRRRAAMTVVGVAFAAVGVVAATTHEPACPRDASALQRSLATHRSDLAAHFDALAQLTPGGAESFAPTMTALERYATRWSDEVATSCAAPAGDAWSGARAQCLDDGAFAFAAVIDTLGTLDEHTIAASSRLASGLPAPEQCNDAALEHLPPVDDHADALALRRRVSTTAQRCRYGLTPDCAAEYAAIADVGERLGVDVCVVTPMVALEQAISAQYGGHPEAVTSALQHAVDGAEACGRDDVKLDAQRILAEHLAHGGDLAGAERTLRSAESTLQRLGTPPSDQIAVHASRASSMLALGRPEIARDALEHALALHEALRGGSLEERAQLLGLLSAALHELGDGDRARALQTEALALRRQILGPAHPSVAHALANLAIGLEAVDLAAARAHNREAIAIFEAHAAGHEMPLAMTRTHQAGFDLAAGDSDAAWIEVERALAMFAEVGASDDAFAADALLIRAKLWARRGQIDAARTDATRALAQLERTRGPSDVTTRAAAADVAALQRDPEPGA